MIGKLEDRREPRYTASQEDLLACTVSIVTQPNSPSYVARIINLSQSGAQLKSEENIGIGQSVQISISDEEMGVAFSVEATVRWSQPAADGHTAFGCILETPIEVDLLEQLATAGKLERRQDRRVAVSIPAVARQELGTFDIEITIEEYSRGGLRLISNREIDLFGRLMITFAEVEKTIVVRPVWQRAIDSDFQVGCQLLERSDSAIISSMIKAPENVIEPRTSRQPWLWCGLAASIMWLILQLFHWP